MTRPLAAAFRRRARTGLAPALAFTATLAAAITIVAAQPVRSPWWTYADADAVYAASSLNLLLGAPVRFVDHPGLPLVELGALGYGVQFAVELATGDGGSRLEFVDRSMLNLDRGRIVFRSIAVAIYLLGATLSFLLLARLFGHWTWGLAGGFLWLAAPGIAPMSIQFRPDTPLAVFCLVFAYLAGRAVLGRSPPYFAGAAVALGFATMVKLHAAGMLPALAIAAVWAHPRPGWWQRLTSEAWPRVRVNRRKLAAVAGAWAALALFSNWNRVPFELTDQMLAAAAVPVLAAGGYLALAAVAGKRDAPAPVRALLDPFYAFVGFGVLVGLWIPITLDLPDGLRSLVNVGLGLTGRGINDPVEPFSAPLDQLAEFPLRQGVFVFAVAGIAAVVGLVRREPLPVVLFVGAAVLAVMAQARLAAIHYFAPAFMLSVPAALWLVWRERRLAAPLLVWPVIAFLVYPQFEHRRGAARDAEAFARSAAPSFEYVQRRLQPGELALAPSYWPHPDIRYFGTVEYYAHYTPPYPYRFVEPTFLAERIATQRSLRFRYLVGPAVGEIAGTQTISLGDLGTYKARRIPSAPDVAELVDGPQVAGG